MVSRAWLFGLVLGVPLVGFGVSEAIQAHLNSELRTVLRKEFPSVGEGQLASITVDRLCQEPIPELRELCFTQGNLTLMSRGALGAGGVGLTLLLLIRLGGRLARGNRNLLLILFKPGLYFTLICLVGLIAVHAAIAMAAIYYGESAITDRVHVGLIFAIGLGAVAGILAMTRSAFALVKRAETVVVGRALRRDQAPRLWELVDHTASRLGSLRPEHVVVGLDPNFFVTEADVVCLEGRLKGRTLYCSLPLCRILSTRELEAVIGHELGHFKGKDTEFSKHFYPIYRGTTSAISSLQATGGEGSRAVALLPAIAILSYFLECFSIAESRLSRERELAADGAAASVTSRAIIAAALVKIHAFAGVWETIQNAATVALREGKLLINASRLFAEMVAQRAALSALSGMEDTQLTHPTDSHPPLTVRLRSLKTSVDDVNEAALDVSPADAAISLISEAEEVEEEISEAYQLLLARHLAIELDRTAGVEMETA